MSDQGQMSIVFIAGPPRSGTTLLNGMIAGGESAYPMLPESSVITSIIRDYDTQSKFLDRKRFDAYYGDEEFLRSTFRNSLTYLISHLQGRFATRRDNLVLKDPELTHYLDATNKIMPYACKVVCCVRDPRDVVASLIAVKKRAGETFNVGAVAEMLFSYYFGIYKAKTLPSASDWLHVVRYEDIVGGVRSELKRLDDFLGFAVDRNGYRDTSYEFDKNTPFFVDTYGKSVTKDRMGSFETELNMTEQNAVVATFAGVMNEYGYL